MNLLNHIVLFPDGNRRWAKERGLPTIEGHKKGYENLLNLANWCKEKGIKALTAFGFSTENWNRSPEEVNYLMRLLEEGLRKNEKDYQKNDVKVRIIGQKERLPLSLQQTIKDTEEITKNNKSLYLTLAISYGGKWDILQAIKKIIQDKIPAEKIDEELFEKYLSTWGLPTPDFIIRVGGELRLSNFLLWQAAYAELYFCPKYWPDFSKEDFEKALEEFNRRQRRFGK